MNKVELQKMFDELQKKFLEVRMRIGEYEAQLKYISNNPDAQGSGYDEMELEAHFGLFGDKKTGTKGFYQERKELLQRMCAIKLALYYENIHGSEIADKLFRPEVIDYLSNALGIILYNQTYVDAEEFIDALSGKASVSVVIDEENNCIILKGEKYGLHYDVKIFSNADGIKIENKCELTKYISGTEIRLVCDIPETITAEGISKDEVTTFEMPDNVRANGRLKSFFGLLVYTNEESSAKRATGRNITEDDIIELMEEKQIVEVEHGNISYDPEKCLLEIVSEDKGTQTRKTYELQFSEKGPTVVYRKKENIKFENISEKRI